MCLIAAARGELWQGYSTYLLLELLVDSVKRVLDCDSLEITSSHLQPQREMQVNLLHRGVYEMEFEDILVLD